MMHFSCQTIAIYGVGLAFLSKSYPSFRRESFIDSIICTSLITRLNVQSFFTMQTIAHYCQHWREFMAPFAQVYCTYVCMIIRCKCNYKCCISPVANMGLAGLELYRTWRMHDWLRGMTQERRQDDDAQTASKTLSCTVDYDGDRTVPAESRFATSLACNTAQTASKTLFCTVDCDDDRTVPVESRFAESPAYSTAPPNPLVYAHQTKCCDYIIQSLVAKSS
jgi:hypothetical protein